MSRRQFDLDLNDQNQLIYFLLNSKPSVWQSSYFKENIDKFIRIKPWCKSLGEIRYCIKHDINTQPVCLFCGNLCNWQRGNYGYTKFCSMKCQNQFRLRDLHYCKNLSNDDLKQILNEFCKTHHCSTWKLSNNDIKFCAKNIIERTNFLNDDACFKERLYYINNDKFNIELCPICKNKPLKWINNHNLYSKTCGGLCKNLNSHYSKFIDFANNNSLYSLYIMEDTCKFLIKIGITRDVKQRLINLKRENKNKNIILKYSTEFLNGDDAHMIEQNLHKKYKQFNKPLIKGNGRTEWFDKIIMNDVINDLKKLSDFQFDCNHS